MKKLIAVVFVLLLGGGGWWFFGRNEPDAPKPPPPDTPYFVKVNPIVVPVIIDDRVVATIAVEILLELSSQAEQPKIKELMPHLMDGYVRSLQAIAGRKTVADGKVDLVGIKDRFLLVSNKIAGPGVIKAILIQRAFERSTTG